MHLSPGETEDAQSWQSVPHLVLMTHEGGVPVSVTESAILSSRRMRLGRCGCTTTYQTRCGSNRPSV